MEDGFAELIAKFQSLNSQEFAKAEKKALQEVGRIVQTAMVANCPEQAGVVEGLLEEGELKSSITARVHLATDEGTVDGDSDRVTIGPKNKKTRDVGEWVENGHANPTAKHGLDHTPAHPWARPAFDSVKDKAVAAYEATMTEEVRKIME